MARANNKKNKQKAKKNHVKDQVIVQKASIAVKEETEQGELFYKIVLAVMLIGLLGVGIFFFVDWLIDQYNNDETTTRFHEHNYITYTDLNRIILGENNENLSSVSLKRALDDFDVVYIYIFHENEDTFTNDTEKNNQAMTDPIIDEIMKFGELFLIPNNEDEIDFYIFDEMAFFFIDASLENNAEWTTLYYEHSDLTGTALAPVLIKVEIGGEDITWYNQITSARDVSTNLEAILNELKENAGE